MCRIAFFISAFVLVAAVLSAQPTPRPGATPPALTNTEKSNAVKAKKNTRERATSNETTGNAQLLNSTNLDAGQNTNATGTTKTIPNNLPAVAPLADEEAVPRIRWISLEEAVSRSKTEKRKVFIDVYTEWCGWCKHMDKTTFTNSDVVDYINKNYYAVKFDAEQQRDIIFKDKTYQFKRNGARGCHELAAEWLNNRLSYPTVVFLDENLNLIQPLAGYLEGDKLETILNYFGTDSHKTTPWETYEKKFNQR